MQKLFRSLIAIGGLAGLAACGDDVSVTEPPPPALTISGAPVTAVSVGAKVQLSASEAATWATSDATVASVDGTGLVTAVKGGVASITATATADVSRKATVTITVAAVANATISVQNITKTGTAGVTVDNNNVVGSIDVNLNVVPGDQVVQRVEVIIDNNTTTPACTQSLGGAQAAVSAEADVEGLDGVIVSCQVNTAAFNSTSGVANFANGSHTLSARAIITGGTQVATPSTSLIFNNQSGVTAVISNTNGTDPASANAPGTGLQWIAGNMTVNFVGVSYVSGTTIASVSCNIFGKDTRSVTLTSGTGNLAYVESGTWSSTDLDVGNYQTATPPESVVCGSATLSNGSSLTTPSGSVLLNYGSPLNPLVGGNAAMPVLQTVRVDNVAPGVNSQNGVVQTAIALGAVTTPWVNASTSLQPAATGGASAITGMPSFATLNASDVGVDAIVVTVNVPPAGGTLPAVSSSAPCPLTGLTAVTTGSQLAATTVSSSYPMRMTFTDALGNRTCVDNTAGIGADFEAPTIVSVTGPAANSFFTSQAAVTDFAFNVTDNASGFGASPVRVSIVRLDSANAAFCVLGGTSCATTNAALAFDATNSLTNNGYYTATYAVRDQAGNTTTPTTTVTYLLDAVAPTWSGGVSLPSVIAGAATNTFTATPADNLDLASVFGGVVYPTINIRYPSQSLGSYGGPLELGGSSIGYAVANWIRCVNNPGDFATTTNQPSLIGLTVTDQAGGAASLASPAFGANAQACGAVGATTITSMSATIAALAATKTEVDRDGANLLTTSATTVTLSDTVVVPINTSVDPFARVEFYYETAPGSNIWRLAGSATGVLAQGPAIRTYTYTFVWDPDASVPAAAFPGASVAVMAIGIDAQGDAVRTTPGAVNIVP